jgi:hypothetical protein
MAKQYGIFMTHPPNVCPISNKASREMAKKGASQLPDLSDKYKVKVTQWYHFDPEHLSVMMVEADNPECVRDLLMEGGFMHWNELRIYPVTTIDDTMMKKMDDIPTIF